MLLKQETTEQTAERGEGKTRKMMANEYMPVGPYKSL